ncbi:MAG: HAMP domain-containing methyl-accepting chemotaxis protein [Myxococcota bacterium]
MRTELSLRMKLTVAVAALVALMAVAFLALVQRWMSQSAETWAERRAVGIALVLSNAMRPALDFDDAADARRLFDLSSGPDLVYAELRRPDGTVLTTWRPVLSPPAEDDAPTVELPAGNTVPVALKPGASHLVHVEGQLLTVLAPVTVGPADQPATGVIRADFSLVELTREQQRNLMLATLAALVIILLGSLLGFGIGTLLVAPVRALTRVTRRIAQHHDLREEIDIHSGDEVGALAESFRSMVHGQRALLNALKAAVEGFTGVIQLTSRAGTSVAESASTMQSRVNETAQSVSHMLGSLDGVASNVQDLQESTRRGSVAIVDMARRNESVAQHVKDMAESVESSSSATDQLVSSVQRIASSMQELDTTVGQTTQAMDRIQRTISAVEGNAHATAQLSRRAADDAQAGHHALEDTIRSIERIRENARTAGSVIERLGRSVGEIHAILGVINDFAHKTNLLALNAAIIASNAGESGTAFNVVAQEIKTLADRTRVSTQEISEVIARVQQEAHTAVAAMREGLQSVEEGERVGQDAGGALRKILDSAHQSSQMVQAIAAATVEEATQTKQVSAAFSRIGTSLQHVSAAAREQARDSERVRNSNRSLTSLTLEVRRSSQHQAAGSKEVIGAMERITSLVGMVHEAQSDQSASATQVLRAVDTMRELCTQQTQSARHLEDVIRSLQAQASEMQAVVQRFRV